MSTSPSDPFTSLTDTKDQQISLSSTPIASSLFNVVPSECTSELETETNTKSLDPSAPEKVGIDVPISTLESAQMYHQGTPLVVPFVSNPLWNCWPIMNFMPPTVFLPVLMNSQQSNTPGPIRSHTSFHDVTTLAGPQFAEMPLSTNSSSGSGSESVVLPFSPPEMNQENSDLARQTTLMSLLSNFSAPPGFIQSATSALHQTHQTGFNPVLLTSTEVLTEKTTNGYESTVKALERRTLEDQETHVRQRIEEMEKQLDVESGKHSVPPSYVDIGRNRFLNSVTKEYKKNKQVGREMSFSDLQNISQELHTPLDRVYRWWLLKESNEEKKAGNINLSEIYKSAYFDSQRKKKIVRETEIAEDLVINEPKVTIGQEATSKKEERVIGKSVTLDSLRWNLVRAGILPPGTTSENQSFSYKIVSEQRKMMKEGKEMGLSNFEKLAEKLGVRKYRIQRWWFFRKAEEFKKSGDMEEEQKCREAITSLERGEKRELLKLLEANGIEYQTPTVDANGSSGKMTDVEARNFYTQMNAHYQRMKDSASLMDIRTHEKLAEKYHVSVHRISKLILKKIAADAKKSGNEYLQTCALNCIAESEQSEKKEKLQKLAHSMEAEETQRIEEQMIDHESSE